MGVKAAIELGDVQRTLLLPLWGRAVEIGRRNPLLFDRAAAEIITKLDYDFSVITENISEMTRLAWIARSLHIDRLITGFLQTHPRAMVVNIGCGLDTTFERVDNGALSWIDLDLPDVIVLRRQLIPEQPRRLLLAASCLNEEWLDHVTGDQGLLFIAAGVLYYFEEPEVSRLCVRLADRFPGAELIFDSVSRLGAKTANKVVIKRGGMGSNVLLKWGLNRARTLETWDKRLHVLADYRLFQSLNWRLPLRSRIGTFISDRLRIMSIVHVRFER